MINIGVAGAGAWGRNLLRNVASVPETALVAVCDPDPEALRIVRTGYPSAELHEEFSELLQNPRLDAVIIATPSHLHFDHARQAIEAGLHALVEKPMCMKSSQANRLISLARQRDRVLMVGHTFLYSNLVVEVKRLITSGELGEVLCIHSQRLNLGRVRKDVDALWNFAPHDISIAGFLLDSWPQTVNARGASFIQRASDIADIAFFQMDYAGGRLAAGHVSWLDPQRVRKTVVVGTEKMLVYDDLDTQRHIQIYDKRVEIEFQSSATDCGDFRTRVRAGDLAIPHIRLVEPLGVEIAHFADCIQNGTTPLTDGLNGLRVVCVLEAMSRSRHAGGAMVNVDYGAAWETDSKTVRLSRCKVVSEAPQLVPTGQP